MPGITPMNRYATILPLTLVLITSAIKEIYEDMFRHLQDKKVNLGPVRVFDATTLSFSQKACCVLKVGNIVRIEKGEFLPADIVLVSSSEPEGVCYVETSSLDGETNLKIKTSKTTTHCFNSLASLSSLKGMVVAEECNTSLYAFEGTLYLSENNIVPVNIDQLLLRGSILKNTNWIYGVVIYTGHDTKLLKNSNSTSMKRSSVEIMTNRFTLTLFIILISLSIISSLGYVYYSSKYRNVYSYLNWFGRSSTKEFLLNTLTFLILYNNLIPVSLMVTMELVKFYQASLINMDLDMYEKDSNLQSIVRNSNMVEELGQIQYILTDKTGTLTCNVMVLKKCIVVGNMYQDNTDVDSGHQLFHAYTSDTEYTPFSFNELKSLARYSVKKVEDRLSAIAMPHINTGMSISVSTLGNPSVSRFEESDVEIPQEERLYHINQFFLMMSLCHTVIPEVNADTGEVTYQASSPDESALVKGVSNLGFKFLVRKPNKVTIQLFDDPDTLETYEILNIFEFTSERKRMSVIIKDPKDKGKIKLFTKGADSVILERIKKENNCYKESTLKLMDVCAVEGLRTLCFAMREMEEEEYLQWVEIYKKASISVHHRESEIEKAVSLIEKDLFLLGATAIEDRLQNGVPETLSTLLDAGIKIWVLTGDKQETAINIGFSSRIIHEGMSIIIIDEDNPSSTKHSIIDKLEYIKTTRDPLKSRNNGEFVLIIEGKALGHVLGSGMRDLFLELAEMCTSVICCRISPSQKTHVVRLVKCILKKVVLAIGDGANDVGMIREANVGVGIEGHEGNQASRSSDYCITQFRYLKKLLLVHGSWSYRRLSKIILYSFYKNIVLYITQFWYSWFTLCSGQTLYESWLVSLYNMIFTAVPPFIIGITDQYVTAKQLMKYPKLYISGSRNESLNAFCFAGCLVNAVFHSVILFGFMWSVNSPDITLFNGVSVDHWYIGTFLYSLILVTVTLKASLLINHWTKFSAWSIVGSMAAWFLFIPFYETVFPRIGIGDEIQGVTWYLYGNPLFWLCIVIAPFMALHVDIICKYLRRQYFPSDHHIMQEFQKYDVPDYRPHTERLEKVIKKAKMYYKVTKLMDRPKDRGFAFSQNEYGTKDIVSKYDSTRIKPTGM